MARYVSSRNVVIRHRGTYETIKFTRRASGWVREVSTDPRVDLVVVPSASVADECNKAVGCKESWAKVY